MSGPIRQCRVLILDYSVDLSEADLFSQWFPENCHIDPVYVFDGAPIPDPSVYTHVMHTGSSLSICADAPFLPEAESTVRRCADLGIPQMGVCYGHQLLSRALLGPSAIGKCPGGIEAGWPEVRMMGSGLSIPGVDPVIRVLQSHFDQVTEIPEGSEVIASNDHTEYQAFVHRQMALFGVQFHPEFNRRQGNSLFLKERKLMEENGVDVDEVVSGGPSIDAGRVFFEYFLSEF